MRLALIGNCSYQALVDDRARVRWLCWPRFDSSCVFGSLLDDVRGGVFSVEPAEPNDHTTSEQHYVPNTNIVTTVFRGHEGSFEVVDFAPRFQVGERFVKPTVLVRILRPLSGRPRVRIRCRPTADYGSVVPGRHVASDHIRWDLPGANLQLTTDLPHGHVSEERSFVLERDVHLVLSWNAPPTLPLAETCELLLIRTRRYWEGWIERTVVPSKFQPEVRRSALALKLHQYEDTGAITAATTTSIPEYPGSGRNWDYRFCWLRDTYFTLGALNRMNHFEETEAFASYLNAVAAKAPDLQPVYGVAGETELHERIIEGLSGYAGSGPVRIGNAAYAQIQNDVYGEMIAAIAPLYLDPHFHDAQPSTAPVQRLLERIEATMDQPDAGLWEIRDTPKVHTFSLLMHWLGATVAGHIGQRRGDADLRDRAHAQRDRAATLIESCFCDEHGYYGDSTSSTHADAALLMMVNLGYLSDAKRAQRHVQQLASRLASDQGLMHRYQHDDGLGDTHATFTVCGFWHAEALARIGRKAEAETIVQQLLAYANHVGLFSEDVDPQSGEQWGNFPQTYSHVGLINAAFAIQAARPTRDPSG